jgi:GTP cyclohydrolase FolE2
MDYQFRLSQREGYLHVWVHGDNTPETVARYLKDVYDACLKHKCSSVLIEENLEGTGLRLTDMFSIVEEGSHRVWPVVRRIAYVDVNLGHDQENLKFVETVARNRAINLRLFPAVRDAENWIVQPLEPLQESP